MKTNSVLRTLAIAVFTVIFSNSLVAQFIGSTTNDQTPIVEERKGGTTTYSLPVGSPATDDYTWAVTGDVVSISPAPNSGDGSASDPYVINWTTGLTSIQVRWAADDSTITSVDGNVSVQQRLPSGTIVCPSQIQSWDVVLWSEATATIATADFEVCSGDAVGGSITVNFTGAPNFDFTYTITDVEGVVTTVNETDITGGSFTIGLPANLVNNSATFDPQTYVITLTAMNDDFLGAGALVNDTFTITVHPTVVTGPISSDRPLERR